MENPPADEAEKGQSIILGGGITLQGFDFPRAEMVVIKKIIGSNIKELQGLSENYESTIFRLNDDKLTIRYNYNTNSIETEENIDNIFLSLNKAIKKIKQMLV